MKYILRDIIQMVYFKSKQGALGSERTRDSIFR